MAEFHIYHQLDSINILSHQTNSNLYENGVRENEILKSGRQADSQPAK